MGISNSQILFGLIKWSTILDRRILHIQYILPHFNMNCIMSYSTQLFHISTHLTSPLFVDFYLFSLLFLFSDITEEQWFHIVVCKIFVHKDHNNTIQIYSVPVMTHVVALKWRRSGQEDI